MVWSAVFLNWASLRDPVKTPVRMTPEILFSILEITGTIRMQREDVKSLKLCAQAVGLSVLPEHLRRTALEVLEMLVDKQK